MFSNRIRLPLRSLPISSQRGRSFDAASSSPRKRIDSIM
jgi:hypothetical protein